MRPCLAASILNNVVPPNAMNVNRILMGCFLSVPSRVRCYHTIQYLQYLSILIKGKCKPINKTCESLDDHQIDWDCVFGPDSLEEVFQRGGTFTTCPSASKMNPCSRCDESCSSLGLPFCFSSFLWCCGVVSGRAHLIADYDITISALCKACDN